MTVYLCGGINALSTADCMRWRNNAKSKLNAAVLDPMRRDYRGIEQENYKKIVIEDKQDILASDIVLVNAVIPSWGTAMEVLFAWMNGIRVVTVVGGTRVSPWIRYHSERLFMDFEDAIRYINNDQNPLKVLNA